MAKTGQGALYLAIQAFVGIWWNGLALYPIHVVGLSFSALTSLLKLDLSQNQLEGKIPNEISNLKILALLDFSNNKISGGLTKSIQEMTSLKDLKALLVQEKVACLADNDARLAVDPNNKYRIDYRKNAGLRWVVFFQDTNGLMFKAIPTALGVSATNEYHVNSLSVPRKAKEAIGGITRLTHSDATFLDPLLRGTGHPDGDVNCETGYSLYPGNINQLILEIGPYMDELSKTGGAIKEFVNPKYKDSTKTAFKFSTRLECMMQDYPKTMPPSARVGFIVTNPWLAYATMKNNHDDAAKVLKGNPYHSATSEERAIYGSNSTILRKAGVKIDGPVSEVFNGQEVEVWSRVVWKPKWAVTFSDVKTKVNGNNNSVSQKSTLVIKGHNVFIEYLSLDGTLLIDSVDDAENKGGWAIENVDKEHSALSEKIKVPKSGSV
ncbi:hypothetical protein L2E82_51346 [Cichorium intybus]|nr:hypothetical protein L2E82_51346 [Cichorium intybus]